MASGALSRTIVGEPARSGWTAAELGGHLAERDIETRPVWKPMHAQPVYAHRRAWLTGAAAVMVGRAAQGNPWVLREIMGDDREPTREEVAAELLLFIRETVRELGEQRATSFLKKFYAWYLGRGRFPKPFKQELVVLPTIAEVELRLLAAAPGAREVLERLEADLGPVDEVLLDSLPISVYGGG